jgi:hypothetical protein
MEIRDFPYFRPMRFLEETGGKIPNLWHGKAAERIVNILLGRPYEPFKHEVSSKEIFAC